MSVVLADLHSLACTGPTADTGCVCGPTSIRRESIVNLHLDAAAEHRDRSEELVTGIEALMGKLAAIPAIPLDVLDRYERALVKAHAANLLRLPSYPNLREPR